MFIFMSTKVRNVLFIKCIIRHKSVVEEEGGGWIICKIKLGICTFSWGSVWPRGHSVLYCMWKGWTCKQSVKICNLGSTGGLIGFIWRVTLQPTGMLVLFLSFSPALSHHVQKKVGGEDSGHDARKMSHQHCSAKMITLMASSVVLYYSSCYNLG